jgi:hypothetical protein
MMVADSRPNGTARRRLTIMAHTILPTQITPKDAEALIVTDDAQGRVRILVMAPHQTLDANRDWIGATLTTDATLALIEQLSASLRASRS